MPADLYGTLRRRFRPEDASAPTRREMLARTLAASAGLLLSARGLSARRQSAGRVLVVGGGFAGLAVAHELTAAGYDVRVFEARNRLGGRVLSFRDLVPGKVVEGGAELIGSNHPAWVSYQRRFGLEFLDVSDETAETPAVLGGRRLEPAEAEALWEEMEHAYTALNELARSVDAAAPWETPGAVVLDAQALGTWIDALPVSPICRQALRAEFTADNGVEASAQSLLANLAQIKGGGLERYWTDSEVFRCKGGNQQLAIHLAASLPAERLHLQTTVRRIQAGPDGCVVTLGSGERVEGDDVVLAVPPSMWGRILIEPPLPPDLRPQMGANVKYLAALRSPFWRGAGLGPTMLADGPVQLTWEGTDGQSGAGVVLTAFSGGPSANECRSWPPAERAARYLRALEAGYPTIAQEFQRGRFMDWPSDAWARGSYSFPAPGQVTSLGPTMVEGLGRLHFAGEHTSSAFVGYMEGALSSGIALATRLAVRDGVLAAPTPA